ncbi:hypothetical protein DID75_04950 [Candidatus Marinamargulisbacteria bacterium SCGC AG-410-N11]|nr:hypothetical protein DID75_04950 [Candidatus Marinamargulisbacteria bacterium SCGC AG-410-N11]
MIFRNSFNKTISIHSLVAGKSPKETAIFSGLASIPQIAFVLPLDTIKNCQQINNTTFKDQFYWLAQKGSRRFFQGFYASFLTVILSRSVGFGCQHLYYSMLKNKISHHQNTVGSSALAGATKSVICLPLDNIKNTIQTMGVPNTRSYQNPTSTISILHELYKSQGLKGFYRGLPNSMQKSALGYSIWIPFRNWAEKTVPVPDKEMSQTIRHFVIGATAGIVTRWVIWPIDKIKTQRQTTNILQGKSTISAFKSIVKKEGFKLYRGIWTQCAGSVLSGAIFNMSWFLFQKNNQLSKD